MNLTSVRLVSALFLRGPLYNCGKRRVGHTAPQVVTGHPLSLGRGCRFYGDDADAKYAGKAPKVAYFIEDEDWALKAMEAAGLVGSEEANSPQVLFLPNPGDGPLTKLLLEMTHCPVITWEPREAFYNHFQKISDEFHGRHLNFEIPFTKQRDFKEILNDHRFSNFKKDANVKLIGNIADIETYIPKVLFMFFSDEGLYKLGDIPQFLFVTGLEYKLMTEPEIIWTHKNYQRTSIYKLFFDVKHILSVPIEAFNRRLVNKSEKFTITYDRENMYLVELRLQDKWFSTSKSDGTGILRLLKTINVKRGQRAIPTMEKWCPDIGLSLLSLGIGMMDKIKNVPLNLWPEIYKELVRNKHYPYSPMKHILEGKDASRTTAKEFLVEEDIDEPACQ